MKRFLKNEISIVICNAIIFKDLPMYYKSKYSHLKYHNIYVDINKSNNWNIIWLKK